MKLIDIISARQTLDKFADKDISGHLSYWMTKFVVKTQADYEFYVNEVRKIFKKYAEKQDGDELVIPANKVADYNRDISELEATEAEDPGIRFDLCEINAELKLTMRQMYTLMNFINEDQ
jgi:hypothetical protein